MGDTPLSRQRLLPSGPPAGAKAFRRKVVLPPDAAQTLGATPLRGQSDAGPGHGGDAASHAAAAVILPVIVTDRVGPLDVHGAEVSVSGRDGGPTERRLRYQWYKSGVELSGEVSSQLTLRRVTEDAFGEYVCVVWNASGRTVSRPATVHDRDRLELGECTRERISGLVIGRVISDGGRSLG